MNSFILPVSDIAHGGGAIGRHNGKVVFVPYTIPGEMIRARLRVEKKDYLIADLIEVINPSPYRTDSACENFGLCGGCNWQHIKYDYQLELKRKVVENQLRYTGKIENPAVRPAIPSVQVWNYRNRADFSVDKKEGLLGFKMRGTHKFIPVKNCRLMHPQINAILLQLQGRCKKKTHNICIRYGVKTGEFLIQPFLDLPDLKTGQPFYREKLLDHLFQVSASSFFQVNISQTEKLIEVVENYIQPKGKEVLIDAYAGVGTFARALAGKVGKVIAIEESKSAVKDALVNLEEIKNVRYYKEKTEDFLGRIKEKVDAVILDPPRAGCFRSALKALVKLYPAKIVYVSCDPATLARDLAFLCENGYELIEIQPVDMFPQTYHIESVALLQRTKP